MDFEAWSDLASKPGNTNILNDDRVGSGVGDL